jgi:dihydropyrimidinase
LDLLLKNGKIVTESAVYDADIGVEDGKIATISKSISDSADRVVDAEGNLVLPGLIDAHTHMEMPFMGLITADDFESGTIGAACGGVTTIIDLAERTKGESLLDIYETWRKKADPKVVIDYSFHVAPLEPDRGLKELISLGVPSFKLFTAYKKDLYTDDGGIFEIMTEMAKYGGMVNVHCENGDLIEAKTRQLHAEGKTDPIYHARSRPPPVEAEAIQRVLRLAEMTGSRVHIVHVSTKSGLDAIIEARSRGLHVSAETCPHYLTFTEEEYLKPNAERLIMSPPLRTKDDIAALWFGLANGDINTVASDHTVFTSTQKKKNDFSQVPNGVPGTETILALLYSEGVRKERISLNDLVRVTSHNPARIFGLYPEKGLIAVGSDADLVIFDPEKKVRLTVDNLHTKLDYSVYEDITATGYPTVTISKGKVVQENGQFTGKKGAGKFIKRRPVTQRIHL